MASKANSRPIGVGSRHLLVTSGCITKLRPHSLTFFGKFSSIFARWGCFQVLHCISLPITVPLSLLICQLALTFFFNSPPPAGSHYLSFASFGLWTSLASETPVTCFFTSDSLVGFPHKSRAHTLLSFRKALCALGQPHSPRTESKTVPSFSSAPASQRWFWHLGTHVKRQLQDSDGFSLTAVNI